MPDDIKNSMPESDNTTEEKLNERDPEVAGVEPLTDCDENTDAEKTDENEPHDDGADEKSDAPVNIEHFSDYRSAKEEVTADDADGDPAMTESEEVSEYEYENLTILDDAEEPTEKLAPHFPAIEERPQIKTKDDTEYNEKKPRGVDARFDIIELFVFTLVAIMLITTFFFRHSVVNGESMINTLQNGDHLIISDLFYTPEQYDIVVVDDPEAHDEILVKRVIAIGGQHIRVESMTEIYVDGVPVSQEFIYTSGAKDELPIVYPFEYDVPEGYVYIMGDHRNRSYDSRWFHAVSEDAIVGKVLVRFYPNFQLFTDEDY